MALISRAAGRVATGFSMPHVALYANNNGTISFSDGMELARGVSVAFDPETTDANPFYANNIEAENEAGVFTGGTMTLTVDGLLPTAEALILGLPEAGEDGVIRYGNTMTQPYVGIGYIVRYRSGGATSFVPYVFPKAKFNPSATDVETQEEEIDWQTEELTANIFRADNAAQEWKWEGSEYATEAEALVQLKTLLNIPGE